MVSAAFQWKARWTCLEVTEERGGGRGGSRVKEHGSAAFPWEGDRETALGLKGESSKGRLRPGEMLERVHVPMGTTPDAANSGAHTRQPHSHAAHVGARTRLGHVETQALAGAVFRLWDYEWFLESLSLFEKNVLYTFPLQSVPLESK